MKVPFQCVRDIWHTYMLSSMHIALRWFLRQSLEISVHFNLYLPLWNTISYRVYHVWWHYHICVMWSAHLWWSVILCTQHVAWLWPDDCHGVKVSQFDFTLSWAGACTLIRETMFTAHLVKHIPLCVANTTVYGEHYLENYCHIHYLDTVVKVLFKINLIPFFSFLS